MDRVAAMLLLLGLLVGVILMVLAFFSFAPIFCSCVVSLLYTLYLFIANEGAGVHHAQEFENRFWTIFAILLSTALFFANDSPIPIGQWSPSLGFVFVISAGFGMHTYDRHLHRQELTKKHGLTRGLSGVTSLNRLKALGIPVEEQLYRINSCLSDIDKLLIPSTINNIINTRFILNKEREIITVFDDAEPKALNYLIQHVKLGLLFYKVKDHRHFSGKHRTELIETLAVTRISVLSVLSRVLVLHALQMMKLAAHPKAEYWVRNIILQTSQDNLSELKTLTDAKGDYFCMNKLLYDDIRSESIRQDILRHLKKEAAVQYAHMLMNTKKAKVRRMKAWRKILSDVDDTLYSSGGSYPAGIDKRYGKKVVYPGVLSFYRELDLGLHGPEEWPENAVGNLVFLSARPHVYKDVSEKHNFAKFEKLKCRGMHTNPSLLAGDLASGSTYMLQNDMEPLALKKFENFKRYVSIYPEFKHVFIGDNGQGDVRAGDLMYDAFPDHLEVLYVHVVKPINQTHGYDPEKWRKKGLRICFFRTYPDAALDAAKRKPPLIRVSGLRRVSLDAIRDFRLIEPKQWPSNQHYLDRLGELNQGLWRANQFMKINGQKEVPLINSERKWEDGQKVKTPYGNGTVLSFDPTFDMYEVALDWRPLDTQVADADADALPSAKSANENAKNANLTTLATVIETGDENENDNENENENDEDLSDLSELSSKKNANVASSESKSDGLKEYSSPIKMQPSGINTSHLEQDKILELDTNTNTNTNTTIQGNSSQEMDIDLPVSKNGVNEQKTSLNLNNKDSSTFIIKAKIQGQFLSKYVTPSLPELQKDKGRSIFSFWGTSAERTKSKEKQYKFIFTPGTECSTPYGVGVIKNYRKVDKIVVVTMRDWSAEAYAYAYLEKDCVQVMENEKGLLGSIFSSSFRKLSQTEHNGHVEKEKKTKELEFPHAIGTMIRSPFGEGIVSRPLPVPLPVEKKANASSKVLSTSTSTSFIHNNIDQSDVKIKTIGISLTSWTLADESHPMLYCTPDTAREWKNMKLSKDKTHLFSVFGNIVSETMKKFTSNNYPTTETSTSLKPSSSSSSSSSNKESEVDVVFERYFLDGASVSTAFGYGRVRSFREKDGFYEVDLTSWVMKDGKSPKAFFQKDSLSHRLAKGCAEGYPVLIGCGLTGTLASVEPTTGVHIVTIPSAGMVCYLQPEQIVKPVKAAVGEDVFTPYGEGTVVRLRITDGIFEVKLKGWGATLYAEGEALDRVDGGTKNNDGSFGINWLLRWVFFSSDKDKPMSINASQRSRSRSRSRANSITSLSARSVTK